jgi:hypothetical protein
MRVIFVKGLLEFIEVVAPAEEAVIHFMSHLPLCNAKADPKWSFAESALVSIECRVV